MVCVRVGRGVHGPATLPSLHWPELSLVPSLTGGRLGSGGQRMFQLSVLILGTWCAVVSKCLVGLLTFQSVFSSVISCCLQQFCEGEVR